MSYAFLIDSIGADKYFQIPPNLLTVEIKKQWSNVEISLDLQSKQVIEWKIVAQNARAFCAFHDNYETISVEVDLSLASEVAVWYRKIVPNE